MTRNSVDFRGPAEQPGSKGQYADVSIHAGLVCINTLSIICGGRRNDFSQEGSPA